MTATNIKSLYADPDFGLKSGFATESCYVLSKRNKCAPSTVWDHMRKNSIEPHGEQGGNNISTRSRKQIAEMTIQNAKLLREWRWRASDR